MAFTTPFKNSSKSGDATLRSSLFALSLFMVSEVRVALKPPLLKPWLF